MLSCRLFTEMSLQIKRPLKLEVKRVWTNAVLALQRIMAGELHMRIVLRLGEFQVDSVSHRPEMKVGCQRPKELMAQ